MPVHPSYGAYAYDDNQSGVDAMGAQSAGF